MQTATSETESKSRDLSIYVHHYTLRAPCPKGQGIMHGYNPRGYIHDNPWWVAGRGSHVPPSRRAGARASRAPPGIATVPRLQHCAGAPLSCACDGIIGSGVEASPAPGSVWATACVQPRVVTLAFVSVSSLSVAAIRSAGRKCSQRCRSAHHRGHTGAVW